MSEVRGATGRSYPASEASGGREETPRVPGQGRQLGGATWHPRPGVVTLRSHTKPEARDGSWKEPPTPEGRATAWRSNLRSAGCAGAGGPRGALPC